MIDIAVVGATGAIGGALLSRLADSELPLGEIHALATASSFGETAQFGARALAVRALADFDFARVAIALFAVPPAVAAEYAPIAAAAGAVVVDCSAQFRREPDVPLVACDVNPDALATFRDRGIVALPGTAAAVLATAIRAIHEDVGVAHIDVATYQGVASAGRAGVNALAAEAADRLSGRPTATGVFPRPIAFNLIAQVGLVDDAGHSDEEIGLIEDMRRLFSDPEFDVNPSCVQVPVFYGHCQVVHLQTRYPLSPDRVRQLMALESAVTVATGAAYATPFEDLDGLEGVLIGRLREAPARENGINFWLVADNLRGGTVRAGIQVVKQLIECYL